MTTRQRQRRQERRRYHNGHGVADPALEQLGIPQRGTQPKDAWIERFWRSMYRTLKAW